jgi:hypothetical protein
MPDCRDASAQHDGTSVSEMLLDVSMSKCCDPAPQCDRTNTLVCLPPQSGYD